MLSRQIRQFFYPIIKKHKSVFLILLGAGFISGLSSVVLPLLLKLETDQLMLKHSHKIGHIQFDAFEVFGIILGLILVINFIEQIMTGVMNILRDSKMELFSNDIQLELFKKMESMEVGRVLSSRFRYISGLIDRQFIDFSRSLLRFPELFIGHTIRFIGIIGVLSYFDIRIFFILLCSSIFSYFIENIRVKLSARYEVEWKLSLGRKQYFFSNLFFSNFKDLATNGAVGSMLQEYSKVLDQFVQHNSKTYFSNLILSICSFFSFSLGEFCVKMLVGYTVFQGTQSIGMVALVVGYMGTMNEVLSQLISLRTSYRDMRCKEALMKIFLLMCEPVGVVQETQRSVEKLSLSGLSFAYPNLASYEKQYLDTVTKFMNLKNWLPDYMKSDFSKLIAECEKAENTPSKHILKGINIDFERGNIYGIVGKNGSGKTTLMYVLSGFFKSYEGKIFINNTNTREWHPSMFASRISFLTQIPFTLGWYSTLREEVLLGVQKKVSDKEIWYYLRLFNLEDRVRSHEKGLDGEIGNDLEFSGGQNQILAFIRVLLQDRDIVILDEGTNQLDAENEVLVMNELLKERKNKIIIFITHRMSTISRADMIYCLENGKISDMGSHKELMQRENIYKKFYTHQIHHM